MIRTRILRWCLIAATAAALAGGLALLYFKTHAVNVERRAELVNELKQLKQLDAEWSLDVLKARMDLHRSYDPLTRPRAAMTRLEASLTRRLGSDPQSTSGAALADLRSALAEKVDIVDQFKAQNAILKNSLRYVPTAIDDLRRDIRELRMARPAHTDRLALLDLRLGQVLDDTLKYNLLPDASSAQQIDAALTELETQQRELQAELVQSVAGVVGHVRAILRQRAIETELLNRISAVPIAQRIDRLNEVIDESFRQALAESDQYRILLVLYSALLLAALAYFGFRLFKSYRVIATINTELNTANETLEQRVEERTAELCRALDDLKDSEAQLIQSEKMASLGQMVAGVAHEINTPLAYVRSSLETTESHICDMVAKFSEEAVKLVRLMRAENSDEREVAQQLAAVSALTDDYVESGVQVEVNTLLREAVFGIDQIAEIVANLKNFSRLDRGRVARYTLEEGVDSTLVLAKHVLKSRKIIKHFGATVPVMCSPSQINQVLLNLITNAAQATTDETGVIRLVTRMQGADRVAIEVVDNGLGIDEAVLPKIFDPFFTTKEVGQGTGLGLSIVYKIVQQHRGEIRVHSKVGVGSKFTVTLPVNFAAENATGAEPAQREMLPLAA